MKMKEIEKLFSGAFVFTGCGRVSESGRAAGNF